jgi:parallel beta-helix repeat protein
MPCATIGAAILEIDATRRVIFVVAGTYTSALIFDQADLGTARVWLIGGPAGPTIVSPDASALTAVGTDLVVESLDMTAVLFGIGCSGGSLLIADTTIHDTQEALTAAASCAVTVRGSTVENNVQGIVASGSAVLTVEESLIKDNDTGIEVASSASPTIRRSRIFSNRLGGIRMENVGRFELTNNFIADNGGDLTSNYGRVSIADSTVPGNVFAHNTVVANQIRNLNTRSAGVACVNTTLAATGNIVRQNNNEGDTTLPPVGPLTGCVWHFSNIERLTSLPAGSDGDDNIDVDVVFVNKAMLDFHLVQATDDADPDSGIAIDIDGDDRGNEPDIGADEFVAP